MKNTQLSHNSCLVSVDSSIVMDPSYNTTGAPPWPPPPPPSYPSYYAATYPSYYGAPLPSAGIPAAGIPVTAPPATFYVHTPQPIGPWSTGLFDCCDDPSNSTYIDTHTRPDVL